MDKGPPKINVEKVVQETKKIMDDIIFENWEELQDLFNEPDIPESTTLIYWEKVDMDKQEIITIAKDQGLDLAEETAAATAKTAINLLKVLLPKVSKGFGLAFNLFIESYEFRLYELIDKIDGEKDLE